eukprot:TRINITY_DN67_c0_g1_i3.p1 TRINITY_DN67_c0_g1~~TRINITY_DN67_c0_g1_i3.p1  ORF type:complete len:556 (+),score=157.11 TRINITY_DN67_c0_g1_i3:55-1722(+)
MSLLGILPTPKHFVEPFLEEESEPQIDLAPQKFKQPPPYGQRQGWVPRNIEDFGDGGAFPEIHVAQYPLDMGRKDKNPNTQVVSLVTDGSGKMKYDAILAQRSGKIMHSRPQDLMEKYLKEEDLALPGEEEVLETTEKTKSALEKLVQGKIAAARPTQTPSGRAEPVYVKYTPAQQGNGFNSGANQRIIRLVEHVKDPLEPPKFKHKRVPGGPPSPPVPVMHSPPRKVTAKDQQDWKIPPCISNWKNAKGYTIPLDKRLAADGRGMQESQINDNFAKLSEALYVAERNAREEVNARTQIQKKLLQKERDKKQEMLRNLAASAREGRLTLNSQAEEDQIHEEEDLDKNETAAKRERDELREERRREREREKRLEAAGKLKKRKDDDRDVSEKVALGQLAPTMSSESMYDQRLFNQIQGTEAGFGEDDSYTVYDKPLFQGSSANALYRPRKGEFEDTGSVEDILKTARFKADREFSGTKEAREASSEPRNRPVEFERQQEEDPFGLDDFLNQAKTAGRNPLDKIGKHGHMHAASSTSSSSSASKRKIDFEGNSSRKK